MKSTYFKNILIPTDFSNTAENAMKHGLALAAKTNASVKFLHTHHFVSMVDASGQLVYTGDFDQTVIEENEKRLQSLQKSAVVLYPNLNISHINQEGFLTDVIQSICENEAIDLVVMGTKGASGIDEYLIGSNTAMVMENVKCPVLIIPENAPLVSYKNILFATDFQFDDVEAVESLLSVGQLFDATIDVVHITPNPKNENDELEWFQEICEERCPGMNINFSNIITSGNTLKTLNGLIVSKRIDLVAMSNSGKNFLKKLFTGSLTQKMAYHTHIPFLAFHVKDNNKL